MDNKQFEEEFKKKYPKVHEFLQYIKNSEVIKDESRNESQSIS